MSFLYAGVIVSQSPTYGIASVAAAASTMVSSRSTVMRSHMSWIACPRGPQARRELEVEGLGVDQVPLDVVQAVGALVAGELDPARVQRLAFDGRWQARHQAGTAALRAVLIASANSAPVW
jgi:hypothetical protein